VAYRSLVPPPGPAILHLRYTVHLPDAPAVSARCRARRAQVAARGTHDQTRALRLSMHAARDDCLELPGWVVVRKPMTPIPRRSTGARIRPPDAEEPDQGEVSTGRR
jgi:hypothetical protein